jgi:hypothetical protein
MTATWYLVRHVPDLRRREPKNVGVVLRTGAGSWLSKFVGETDEGILRRRDVPRSFANFEVYESWVDYFRRKLSDEAWGDVEHLQSRRKGNYFAERGGQIFDDRPDWKAELDALFSDLVKLPEKKRVKSPLAFIRREVDSIFDAVELPVIREVRIEADYDGRRTTVPFRYEYVNGQPHIMDIVQVHATNAAADARELRSRFEAVRVAGAANSFVSFFSSKYLDEEHIDDILAPIERLSLAVDVDNREVAIETVARLTQH